MFGGRGKLSRKDFQKNMKAMLAKTKISNTVTQNAVKPNVITNVRKSMTISKPLE